MDYFEVTISYSPVTEENNEILIAILGELPFESFTEQDYGVVGYLPSKDFNKLQIEEALSPVSALLNKISIQEKLIKEQNWNATWEESFSPINIDKKCRIRAPFHETDPSFEYEILIEPKMSFGTGHHDTTAGMMKLMLDLDFENKTVLDMGCGTGVLAILAAMKNAKHITAIDIDNWAYENSIENALRNNINNIDVKEGDAKLLKDEKFECILANINRNILLNDMDIYSQSLEKDGSILFSGFYLEDLPMITEKAETCGLTYIKHIVNNNWVATHFVKKA